MPSVPFCRRRVCAALLIGLAAAAQAQERQVYRCPGNLYTDQLTPREAQERGCKTLDGLPVSVIQSPVRRAPAATGGSAPVAAGSAPVSPRPDLRIDSRDQRARDSDARRILESELRKEEERLSQLKKEFNQGEPERRGDERNYARYQERVAEMKAAIARKEADIAALRRELAKLPASP
ncbi:hypothetical protein C7444_11353 [Sphaerotilus hippei]|uniref:DUF4124 domain-containing protein n=1 Tax=Sphaerotilus hippei TaxID=744406 RepID=A0A318GXN0_9BURK|nr:hypothetical protein [Sphaerotilus hippei]PXW94562.1 hypothetical protein C7444_11353 [Sphaerotilus hippei]